MSAVTCIMTGNGIHGAAGDGSLPCWSLMVSLSLSLPLSPSLFSLDGSVMVFGLDACLSVSMPQCIDVSESPCGASSLVLMPQCLDVSEPCAT